MWACDHRRYIWKKWCLDGRCPTQAPVVDKQIIYIDLGSTCGVCCKHVCLCPRTLLVKTARIFSLRFSQHFFFDSCIEHHSLNSESSSFRCFWASSPNRSANLYAVLTKALSLFLAEEVLAETCVPVSPSAWASNQLSKLPGVVSLISLNISSKQDEKSGDVTSSEGGV